MPENRSVPPLQGAIITGLHLVERLERKDLLRFNATSLPGHLIHFVLKGRVEQYSSGMRQELSPGCTVWYHEDETVTGRVLESPWVFYTVSFNAPSIQPPPFDRRVSRYNPEALRKMEALYQVWHDTGAPATTRRLRTGTGVFARLPSRLRQDPF